MNDTLRPDELIIGDDNYKDFCAPIGESTILLPDGSHRAFGFAGRQHPFGYAFGKIETRVPLIPRSEWKQRILEGGGGLAFQYRGPLRDEIQGSGWPGVLLGIWPDTCSGNHQGHRRFPI